MAQFARPVRHTAPNRTILCPFITAPSTTTPCHHTFFPYPLHRTNAPASFTPHRTFRTAPHLSHRTAPSHRTETPPHRNAPAPSFSGCRVTGQAKRATSSPGGASREGFHEAEPQGTRHEASQNRIITIIVPHQAHRQPSPALPVTRGEGKTHLSSALEPGPTRQAPGMPNLPGTTQTPRRLLPRHQNVEWKEISLFKESEREDPQPTGLDSLHRLATAQPVHRHVRKAHP
jgi:hypothetical protein